MTREEKELLLKDLCARLPYGVKIRDNQSIREIKGIVGDRCYFNNNPRYDGDVRIEDIKPYLRPLSSMTDEEKDEFRSLGGVMSYSPQHDHWALCAWSPEGYDWLNEHHFDYRGLIEKGLAIDCTNLNIY